MDNFDQIEMMNTNDEEHLNQYMIVQLNNPRSNRRKGKSGLVRISSFRHLRNVDQRLRTQFKFWIPSSCRLSEIALEGPVPVRTESIDFDDVTRAIEYIESCDDGHIILILSAYYARDKRILLQFKQLPQIVLIYRCISDMFMQKWFERWSIDTECFVTNLLPSSVVDGQVQDLDEASQLVLIQFFLTEIILKQQRTDRAKEEFFEFCRLTYANDPANLRKVEAFRTNYAENTPIHWYTDATCIFRIVSRVCASFDFTTLFKIRFFLRDLYLQLQQLHQAQLPTLLRTDLKVYRGARMSLKEFSRLRIIGHLFVTRNFLSTSTAKDVACAFSGERATSENQVSVLICVHIDREELSEKPVAFISNISQFEDEAEVMLSMGIVLRVVSCMEVRNNDTHVFKIRMIRGKEEQEIEKKLSRLRLVGSMALGSPFLTMATVLNSIESSGSFEQIPRVIQHTNHGSIEQLNNVSGHTENAPKDTNGQAVFQNGQKNLTIDPTTASIASTKHTVSTAYLTGILHQSHLHTIIIILGTLIVASAIVVPLSVILSSGTLICDFYSALSIQGFDV